MMSYIKNFALYLSKVAQNEGNVVAFITFALLSTLAALAASILACVVGLVGVALYVVAINSTIWHVILAIGIFTVFVGLYSIMLRVGRKEQEKIILSFVG